MSESQPLQVTKGSEHARQSSPQKGQIRAHHSSIVRTLLAAGSAAYRLQSGHAPLQSKTIRTSDIFFTTVIWLHTKRIFLSALHPNIVFRRNLQERFWHNAVLPLQLQKSGTVYRKISKTVVLWKLSDANLKLTCLTVHFLPRLVSPTPTNRLL